MCGIWKTEVHLQGFVYNASALQICTAAFWIQTTYVYQDWDVMFFPVDVEGFLCSDFDGEEGLIDRSCNFIALETQWH